MEADGITSANGDDAHAKDEKAVEVAAGPDGSSNPSGVDPKVDEQPKTTTNKAQESEAPSSSSSPPEDTTQDTSPSAASLAETTIPSQDKEAQKLIETTAAKPKQVSTVMDWGKLGCRFVLL